MADELIAQAEYDGAHVFEMLDERTSKRDTDRGLEQARRVALPTVGSPGGHWPISWR